MAERPTRTEIESRLREKADAISGRIGKLESVLPGSGLKVPSALKKKRNLKVGAAIGAGFLVGYMLLNRSGKNSRGDYSEQLERLADRLGDAIATRLRRDMGADDAVRDALEEIPPMVELQQGREGILHTAVKQLLKTGGSTLVNELSRWLQDRLLEENEHPESKGS